MKRRIVHFTWEDEDAQACFAEWCPFPGTAVTAQEVDRIESLLRLAPPLEYREHQRAFSCAEVLAYLHGVGFVSVDAYKDFDRQPANEAEFNVFICKS